VNARDLTKTAFDRRLDVLEMVYNSKAGHIGGSMSCMDILTVLYYSIINFDEPNRDRFILSKGHCAEALYAVLADKGFFPKEKLATFGAFDTILAEHPTKGIPGVEVATGALGHGLSIGVGMAIGLRDTTARVYVLMGDGELAEGSVWEAAMAASKFKLDGLVAIIDRNKLQISGETETVMPLGDIEAKFSAFGWAVRHCNGHDPQEIHKSLLASGKQSPQGYDQPTNQPTVLICETIKGYGSTIMENKPDWHHQIPNHEEYQKIKTELQQRRGAYG